MIRLLAGVLALSAAAAAAAKTKTKGEDATLTNLKAVLQGVGGPILRTVLSVDNPPWHPTKEWDVLAVRFDDEDAAALWKGKGEASIVLDEYVLPLGSLAVDAVALGVGERFSRLDNASRATALAEAVRVLVPDGVLVVLGEAKEAALASLDRGVADTCDWSRTCSKKHPERCVPLATLVEATDYANVFRRKRNGPGGGDCETAAGGDCKPFPAVPSGYRTIASEPRQKAALSHGLTKGRLAEWDEHQLLETYPTSWAARFRKTSPSGWRRNYVNPHVKKREWPSQYTKMIEDGRIKRVLDAGAGTCSLDATLRSAGVRGNLDALVSFGFYDCSMARVAAERGSITLDWTWLDPLPLCSNCTFDLVFQAEGMHHTSGMTQAPVALAACTHAAKVEALRAPVPAARGGGASSRALRGRHHGGSRWKKQRDQLDQPSSNLACSLVLWTRTFDNFDAHLACGGTLFLADSDDSVRLPPDARSDTPRCWMAYGIQWAKARGYHVDRAHFAGGSPCKPHGGSGSMHHSELVVKKTC